VYGDIRKVLCHELAHNVIGDHNDNVCPHLYLANLTLTLGPPLVQTAELQTK
jgi:hypothetical protein